MIKNYRITVDGKSYEVEVEDVESGSSEKINASAVVKSSAIPAQQTEQKAVSAISVASEPADRISLPSDDSKGERLRAPMPGTILSVSASVGQIVKRGDILLVLEAMKMENEIVAHIDGTISGIFVQKGSTVNAGDTLVTFA